MATWFVDCTVTPRSSSGRKTMWQLPPVISQCPFPGWVGELTAHS
jgi:hypothetical protein